MVKGYVVKFNRMFSFFPVILNKKKKDYERVVKIKTTKTSFANQNIFKLIFSRVPFVFVSKI